MRKLTTVFAAVMAALLFAACAKKEEAPAPEAAPAAAPAEPAETAPADAAPPADGSADAEASGGDKVSEPEPPPSGG